MVSCDRALKDSERPATMLRALPFVVLICLFTTPLAAISQCPKGTWPRNQYSGQGGGWSEENFGRTVGRQHRPATYTPSAPVGGSESRRRAQH